MTNLGARAKGAWYALRLLRQQIPISAAAPPPPAITFPDRRVDSVWFRN